MADEPMTRFPVPDIADLPDDIQERIEAETEQAGFTPSVGSENPRPHTTLSGDVTVRHG